MSTLLGCTIAVLLLFLPTAPDTSASSIAQLAARLAADVQQLADAREELHETRAELRAVRGEHRRLRSEVEGRLVAIYKLGGSQGALERIAGGESMRDVGTTLDVLDHVAEHDEQLLVRWRKLDDRRTRLVKARARLEPEVRRLEQRVQTAREKLSAAEAAVARARREAEQMARIADSPLLPKVGHPETKAVEASGAVGVSSGQPIGYTQSGTASVYHDSFTGETTANGEHYDPNAFTAAHPSLPFGTWVTVSGPGGSIQVRINDRGPFVGGRIIDLSAAAGAAIGISLGSVTLSVAA
jgi:rare lipoprotein A